MDKPPCVVVDSNYWRSTLLLRTGLGPSLVHLVHRMGGRIGLPEVIDTEIRKHVANVAQDASDAVTRGFRELGAIVGRHRPYSLPSASEVAHAIDLRFAELTPLLEAVPITLEATRSALARVNAGSAPNTLRNQQFKDSLIWEAALALANRFDVHFVTMDSGFFDDRKSKKASEALIRECAERRLNITVYGDLGDCLKVLLGTAPDIDRHRIALSVLRSISSELDRNAENSLFRITKLADYDVTAFVTELPDVLTVAFRLTFDAMDAGTDGRTDVVAIVEGEGRYRSSTDEMDDVALHSINYDWRLENGERRFLKAAYMRVNNAYHGPGPYVRHVIRDPLP